MVISIEVIPTAEERTLEDRLIEVRDRILGAENVRKTLQKNSAREPVNDADWICQTGSVPEGIGKASEIHENDSAPERTQDAHEIHLNDSVRELIREAHREVGLRVLETKGSDSLLSLFQALGIWRHVDAIPVEHLISPGVAAGDIELILKILKADVSTKNRDRKIHVVKNPLAYEMVTVKAEIKRLGLEGKTHLQIGQFLEKQKYPCPPNVGWRQLGWVGALKSKTITGAKDWITRAKR
ncbi:MAG: hypothetical protein ABJF23_29955 [Bryobacteraceae bacterium]